MSDIEPDTWPHLPPPVPPTAPAPVFMGHPDGAASPIPPRRRGVSAVAAVVVVSVVVAVASLLVVTVVHVDSNGRDAEMRALLAPISQSEAAMGEFNDTMSQIVADAALSENGSPSAAQLDELESQMGAQFDALGPQLEAAQEAVCSQTISSTHRDVAAFQAAYCAHLDAWLAYAQSGTVRPLVGLNSDAAITSTFLAAIDAAQAAKVGRGRDVQEEVDRLFAPLAPSLGPANPNTPADPGSGNGGGEILTA